MLYFVHQVTGRYSLVGHVKNLQEFLRANYCETNTNFFSAINTNCRIPLLANNQIWKCYFWTISYDGLFYLIHQGNHYILFHIIVLSNFCRWTSFFFYFFHLRATSIGWMFHLSFLGNLVLQTYFCGMPANDYDTKVFKAENGNLRQLIATVLPINSHCPTICMLDRSGYGNYSLLKIESYSYLWHFKTKKRFGMNNIWTLDLEHD